MEVWTGEREGVFKTSDLDFIGPDFLTAYKIQEAGIEGAQAVNSRHILVEGVPVEFPVGPLGVGDALLDPMDATVLVPTLLGDEIRCLRPEACVLDRLTAVAVG